MTSHSYRHRFVRSVLCIGTTCSVVAGCASSSEDISAAYISPIEYQSYTCVQISEELARVSDRARQVAGTVDNAATNDKVAMGVGLVLFWPALFMLKGNGPQQQELAQLKGQYDALNQAAIAKNCRSAVAPPEQTIVAANASGSGVDFGITGSAISRASTAALNMRDPHGVWIESITPSSPADTAGLKAGDVIQSFNGRPINTFDDLKTDIAGTKAGSSMSFGVWRADKAITLTAVVAGHV